METNKTYGWFKMYWDFLDKLTPESALLLSYLIEVNPIIKKRDGEYFRLSNSFIQERFLTWSNYTIKTKLDELVSKGFIQTKEMYEQEQGTKHKTRWVKINNLTKDVINDLNNDLTENFGIKENKDNKENKEIYYNGKASLPSNKEQEKVDITEKNGFFEGKVDAIKSAAADEVIADKKNIDNDAPTSPPPVVEKPKRQSLKEQLTEYVNGTQFTAETKEVLLKWIFNVGLQKNVRLEQLRDKLKDIWEQCNGNEALVRKAIHQAYLNSWCGFFKPSEVSKPTPEYKTPAQPEKTPCTPPAHVRVTLGNEVF